MNKREKILFVTFTVFVVAWVIAITWQNSREDQYVLVPAKIVDTRCYASREFKRYAESDPGGYAYEFARFDIYDDSAVGGELGYFPYGTDSAWGTYRGIYDKRQDVLKGVYSFSSEGMDNIEERYLKLTDVGFTFGFGKYEEGPQGVFRYADVDDIEYDYPLELVSCKRYDVWYREFKQA